MDANAQKKPPGTAPGAPPVLEHQISLRAHELYEARGREDGHAMEDWLRAEEEITNKKAHTIAA